MRPGPRKLKGFQPATVFVTLNGMPFLSNHEANGVILSALNKKAHSVRCGLLMKKDVYNLL